MRVTFSFAAAVFIVSAFAVIPIPLRAQMAQEACALTCSGNWASNSTYRLAYSGGQSASGVCRGSDCVLYGGFIGGAMLQPGTLSGNGIPVEVDPDNDGDQLTDSDEVTGAAFGGFATTDPNNPDTDGDGMSDRDESLVMFDPNDPGHVLRITAINLNMPGTGAHELKWIGKGNNTRHEVFSSTDLTAEPCTNVFGEASVSGGTAPWYKSTVKLLWWDSAFPATSTYFRVEIHP